MDKPIAVIGLGALGSVVAGLLARAGLPVVGICRWRRHRDAIQNGGLLLREGDQEQRVPLEAFTELPAGRDYRLAIVLVKSFDTEEVACTLARCLGSSTPVLTLQNGLGNVETLAAHLSAEQVLAGSTTFGALREGPGAVRITGRGACEIGAWRPAAEHRVPAVCELLQRAGIECRQTANVTAVLWKKLAVNAVINPLTAILRVPNGELLERPGLEPIFAAVVEEVWRVAARHQVALPTPPELQEEVRRVCRLTAANRSSMLRDVEHGRRTEIDAINGAVVRLGLERGALSPANTVLAGLVQALSASAAGESTTEEAQP